MKNVNSHIQEVAVLKNTKPALRYDGKIPFEEWQKQARERLMQLLGFPLEHCDPDMSVESQTDGDGYTEYRFTVQTEPGYYVPCHLRIPTGVEGAIPLTLCLSGHGGGMHVALGVAKTDKDRDALQSWPHRAMAARAIREGRAALVMEARNFGESSLEGYGTSCKEAAKIAILMGRTVIGERVWDAMRILDAVSTHFSQIDMTDIVCTGNSGGGTATYYLACCDERIGVAMPSCSVCTYETSIAARSHCMCNHIPSIRKYFEMGDVGGLIAPRKLIVAGGSEDKDFPRAGTEEAFRQIKTCYEAAGVPQNCALIIAEGGHLNYADHLWDKLKEMR